MTLRKSNIAKRLITAVLLIPIVALIIIYSSDFIFLIILILFITIANIEFVGLIRSSGQKILVLPVVTGTILLPVSFYLQDKDLILFSIFAVMLLSFTIKLLGNQPLTDTYKTISFTLVAVLYIPFFLSFIFWIKTENIHYIFYILFIIWASDTSGYLIGSKFGTTKLYKKISPNKTIEGLIASYIGGLIIAFLYAVLFIEMPYIDIFFSGLLIISAGILGDLVESMFKRRSGIKDSGFIFPGHGGMLDRIDSLLMAFPILYFYISFSLN